MFRLLRGGAAVHGGSPQIYSGEERFSAPKMRRILQCALALGTSRLARHAASEAALESCPEFGRAQSLPYTELIEQ